MNIEDHEKTFASFVRATRNIIVVILVFLIFLAILNS